MAKKFLYVIGVFIGVLLALGIVKASQIKEASSAEHTPPPSAVTTAEANQEEWHPQLRAVGTLAPVQGVMLTAELDGTVVRIAVENGAQVKQGDLLLELDAAIEQAQLASAQARAELARLQWERSTGLLEKETISQAELDGARAQFDQARAEVAAIQATIDKKRVRAPFSGRVGIRSVNLGQYVSRGTPLLPLQQLDPIYVNFSIPQRQLPLVGLNQPVHVVVDAFPNQPFVGQVTAINTEVDPSTRNVTIQATLPNSSEHLRAGMFAQLDVVLPQTETVVVVPATAVAYAPYGNSVYVVEKIKGENGEEYLGVRQQPVRVGRMRGDQVAILEGLNPGEQVVTTGIFKLRNAMPVQINNSIQAANQARPRPNNT
jgi:membrane fusion protein, multidrug efflux system